MKKNKVVAVIALFACVTLSGCAGLVQMTKKIRYPSEVTAQMRSEFDQAENFYSHRSFDDAAHAYQRYIDTYAYNRLTDEANYKQGKIQFLKRDYARAIEKFRMLSDHSPDPQYHAKGAHMTAYAQYKNGDHTGALATLGALKPELLPSALRMQSYSLMILSSQTSGELAMRAMLGLYDLYEGQDRRLSAVSAPDVIGAGQLKDMIDAWMATPLGLGDFPVWMRRFPSGPARALIDYKMARTYYEEKNLAKARRLLTAFMNSYPKNRYASAASTLLKELGGPDHAPAMSENFRVGVLLPLSGAQMGFGEAVLKGVRCAAGENGVCNQTSNVEVVVRDAGFAPDMIRQAIDELVGQRVSGIISILPGTLAMEAATYASEKNTPIFLISQQDGLMRQGASVFQMGLSPERQVKELVEVAHDKGLRNIAIFHPNIPYGQKMAELFNAAVEAKGDRIVSKVSYDKQALDPFAEAKKLKTEIEMKQVPGGGNEELGAGVDAIFIPDTYQAVNSIASALEFNQLTGMPLIGTNTWNDRGLSQSIANSFPESFFIDLYDTSSQGAEIDNFRQNFQSSFGGDPQVLNALGYDSMMMIRSAATSNGPERLAESLGSRFGYRGVTGISGFKAGESPIVRLKVIAVKDFTGAGY